MERVNINMETQKGIREKGLNTRERERESYIEKSKRVE